MMDVFKVSEIIVNHIKANYSQDVAIVGLVLCQEFGQVKRRNFLI